MRLPDYKEARTRDKRDYKRVEFSFEDSIKGKYTGKTFFLKTYGCQMNEHDSENIEALLIELGFSKVDDYNLADLVLLNTCSIRENAHNKAFGMLGRLKHLKQEKPELLVGLCGCMAQEASVVDEILKNYKFVNFVFGTHNMYQLPEIIDKAIVENKQQIEVFSREGDLIEGIPVVRTNDYKAYVNIIYGCNKFCTYCIVPYTRGSERSRAKEDILKEVDELISEGYKEITLLGQNVNAYGKDLGIDYTFGDLLRDLDQTGIERIHYTTSHPRDLDLNTIKAMGECKSVMPNLHLPVQSGDNTVLKRMNRKYTHEEYVEKIKLLREYVPGISITTDIIVAFPGETEEQFQHTLDLVEEVGFEGAFTFIYSPREGTPAATYENLLTEEEKHQRLNRLVEKTNEGYLKGHQRFLGQVVKVLVDGFSKNNPEYMTGYSEHRKVVNFKPIKANVGDIVSVKITEAKTWFMNGEQVDE